MVDVVLERGVVGATIILLAIAAAHRLRGR